MKLAMEKGDIAPGKVMAQRMDDFHDEIRGELIKLMESKSVPKEAKVTVTYWGARGLKITLFGLIEKDMRILAVAAILPKLRSYNVEKIYFEFYERQETRKSRAPEDNYTSVETVSVNKISEFMWNITE
jgi:hypothetical protein